MVSLHLDRSSISDHTVPVCFFFSIPSLNILICTVYFSLFFLKKLAVTVCYQSTINRRESIVPRTWGLILHWSLKAFKVRASGFRFGFLCPFVFLFLVFLSDIFLFLSGFLVGVLLMIHLENLNPINVHNWYTCI